MQLDSYILRKNILITKKRTLEEDKILKAANKEGLSTKELKIKLSTLKTLNPQTTKRSIIEAALAEYFDKYPV